MSGGRDSLLAVPDRRLELAREAVDPGADGQRPHLRLGVIEARALEGGVGRLRRLGEPALQQAGDGELALEQNEPSVLAGGA